MKKLSISMTGIVLSALLIAPVYAGLQDNPAIKPGKTPRSKPGQDGTHSRVGQARAGAQLDERVKRSAVKKRAAEMKEKMLIKESGQQGQ